MCQQSVHDGNAKRGERPITTEQLSHSVIIGGTHRVRSRRTKGKPSPVLILRISLEWMMGASRANNRAALKRQLQRSRHPAKQSLGKASVLSPQLGTRSGGPGRRQERIRTGGSLEKANPENKNEGTMQLGRRSASVTEQEVTLLIYVVPVSVVYRIISKIRYTANIRNPSTRSLCPPPLATFCLGWTIRLLILRMEWRGVESEWTPRVLRHSQRCSAHLISPTARAIDGPARAEGNVSVSPRPTAVSPSSCGSRWWHVILMDCGALKPGAPRRSLLAEDTSCLRRAEISTITPTPPISCRPLAPICLRDAYAITASYPCICRGSPPMARFPRFAYATIDADGAEVRLTSPALVSAEGIPRFLLGAPIYCAALSAALQCLPPSRRKSRLSFVSASSVTPVTHQASIHPNPGSLPMTIFGVGIVNSAASAECISHLAQRRRISIVWPQQRWLPFFHAADGIWFFWGF
ncbi:hypothetical protein C8J57DRAFT_1231237 [Mycena rebaudengoi]|nr:hypothetical protein C8J57DRAFT_1231237 [Mycena rebaudengoi]